MVCQTYVRNSFYVCTYARKQHSPINELLRAICLIVSRIYNDRTKYCTGTQTQCPSFTRVCPDRPVLNFGVSKSVAHAKFLTDIKFADLLFLRLWNCERPVGVLICT